LIWPKKHCNVKTCMPFYQYFCEANQQTVEVRHAMSERLKTWAQVCAHAGIDPGSTPSQSPVVRLISAPLTVVWRVNGLDKEQPSARLLL